MGRIRFLLAGASVWLRVAVVLALGVGTGLALIAVLPSPILRQIALLGPFAQDRVSAAVTAAVFIVTAGFGLRSALRAERMLERERRIGQAIAGAIETAREDIALGRSAGFTVEGLQSRFIGAVKTSPRFRVDDPQNSIHARILHEVQDQAANLRYDPVPTLVERFAGAFLEGGPRIKVWQNAAVRLGILVTFVGLIQSLVPVQEIMANRGVEAPLDASAIRTHVGAIVAGLAIAFGSSIAGLLSALILQIALGSVSLREQRVIASIGDLVAQLQYIASRVRNDTVLSRSIQALNAGLDEHKREVYLSAKLVSEEVVGLASRIADIREAHAGIAEVLRRQTEAQERGTALAATLATVDQRLAALFDRRLAAAAAATDRTAADTQAALRALGETTIAEIRNGWGRDARSALETALADRLDGLVARLDVRDEARLAATERIARTLAVGVGLALLAIVAAGAVLLVAGAGIGQVRP